MTTPESGAPGRAGVARIAALLHRFSELTGNVIAWLTLPMVIVTFLNAFLRYAFAKNFIWSQELVVWMHALVFMLAAAYTLNRDEHVRVDIFYREFSERRKALVNLIGCLVFLLPVTAILIFTSLDYVVTSWSIGERSREAGGLPFPFVPLLKSVIPLAFGLVAVQGVAIICDTWGVLVRGVAAMPPGDTGSVPPGEGV